MAEGESWKNTELVTAYLDGIRGGIPLAKEQVDIVLRLIAHAGVPVRRFLDLGCGDGFLGAVLLDGYPQSSGTFVDFSDPMLEAARERLAVFGGRAAIEHADLSSPGWRAVLDEAPFDAIVSGFAIHHLTDRRKRELYGEIHALLSPGAFFLNIEHVSSPTPWLESVFDEALTDSFYEHQLAIGHSVTRQQVAKEYVHRPDKQENILAPVETQCTWLRELGYVNVDCFFKLLELAVFGGRRGG
jgi:cyclopropane fatty-acyl-phospholipid synthase-like methyltransferase